jgi:predicted protein tyrosine phosphatase
VLRALFVCGRNRLRSPTAERIFSTWPGVEADSAGLNPDADTPLSAEQIEWADIIFVMESSQRGKMSARFQRQLKSKRLICLDIADKYGFMQPELVALLEAKAGPLLR